MGWGCDPQQSRIKGQLWGHANPWVSGGSSEARSGTYYLLFLHILRVHWNKTTEGVLEKHVGDSITKDLPLTQQRQGSDSRWCVWVPYQSNCSLCTTTGLSDNLCSPGVGLCAQKVLFVWVCPEWFVYLRIWLIGANSALDLPTPTTCLPCPVKSDLFAAGGMPPSQMGRPKVSVASLWSDMMIFIKISVSFLMTWLKKHLHRQMDTKKIII